jgi:hypothetical protein
MKKFVTVTLVAFLTLGILLAAGCGGSNIAGTYVDKSGTAKIVLKNNGAYEFSYDGEILDRGTYKVEGDYMMVTYEDGGMDKFKIDEGSLIAPDGTRMVKQ